MKRAARAWACALCLGAAGHVLAQPGIYTCVDGRGNRITSDRPITECMDRTQKELNPSGTVRRNVGPSLTAAERAQEEARAQKAAEEQARSNEERRRSRAMLMRYQNQDAHDRERAAALANIDAVLAVADKRLAELAKERVGIANEMEFYQAAPDKAPAKLKRQAEENTANATAQQRFIAEQQAERARVNARFDEELAQLRVLWAERAMPGRPR
ncbi:DUF4124 domain-containing protein [Pseudorhodoferax sp. Leaf267]|uniref:DUF4124 domain-containing protein n=1 Tax=Pseudorhodoferax sp. Leaf267 TaxID=1736316 RepID=UPI0006F6DA15|nr:DUF4124 domain-containing protein [Pseudorhodoferax sp. Leaf267]KQP12511.1 hypothetical protein ASF43_19860 [Pseudorhodoferax sp. Leaf267]